MVKKLSIIVSGSLFAFSLLVSLMMQDTVNAKPKKEAEKGTLYGVRIHCFDKDRVEKIKAESYDAAVQKAIVNARVANKKCHGPENMVYYTGSYECQVKKKKAWSLSYKVWAVNPAHEKQIRDEKIKKKKGKIKCDAAGGGSSAVVGEANSAYVLKNAKDDWDWK